MTVYPGERELLAQFLGVAVVGLNVDRTLKEECLVQAVQLLGKAARRLPATQPGYQR
jgi:hypothetical protein